LLIFRPCTCQRGIINYCRIPKEVTPNQVLSFFDGRPPSWRDILSSHIEKRDLVDELYEEIIIHKQDQNQVEVRLILGAGGEGKSTILYQTIHRVVELDSECFVLFHQHTDTASLPSDTIIDLANNVSYLIVASDESHSIARQIREVGTKLKQNNLNNVLFLICSRGSDWRTANAHRIMWHPDIDFAERKILGVGFEEAKRITRSWAKYDRLGLGDDLYNVYKGYDDSEEAIRKTSTMLCDAATEEISNSRYEGSFFGAMLQLRYGRNLYRLRDRLQLLLEHIGDTPIPNGTMLEALACIASPHAEGHLILSREVLGAKFGCSTNQVRSKILGPLADEALVNSKAQTVLLRHRRVALELVDILEEKYDYDRLDIIDELVGLACGLAHSSRNPYTIPHINAW